MVGHESIGTRLPILYAHASPSKAERIKALREDAATQSSQSLLVREREQQQLQYENRFHGRWNNVRVFYATVTERVDVAKRAVWLRTLATHMHRALVGSSATTPQLESLITGAIRPLVSSSVDWKDILLSYKRAIQMFQRQLEGGGLVIDYREILCACIVLDRWHEGELVMLSLWLNEYALPSSAGGAGSWLSVANLKRVLLTPCAGLEDEHLMAPHLAQIIASASRTADGIHVQDVLSYTKDSQPHQRLLKDMCWRRLTDDMRLSFYRRIYEQAMESVEREEQRCRFVAALNLWWLREPRARLARWKDFVSVRKLRHKGDAHFVRTCQLKIVHRFSEYHARKTQMKKWLATAQVVHHLSVVRRTMRAWQLYRRAMLELHRAAARRSVLHFESRLLSRTWRGLVQHWQTTQADRARRQSRLESFIRHRHRKMLVGAWGEWLFVHRRHQEVAVAKEHERQLHTAIDEVRREHETQVAMAAEDAISQAVEEKERDRVEQARRRAFQEATDKVYANRKIQLQEEERTRFKRLREEKAVAELDEAWARIRERVAGEVRVSTVAWLSTPEGIRAIQTEAAEIFDRDAALVQKALMQDPHAYAVPGCRWQLGLEDYGGRFAKAFYLNTETLEKFMCDELVIENCEDIAREILIQRNIDEARLRMQAKAGEVNFERCRHLAAHKIQSLFKCRHALLIARAKIRSSCIKRIEPMTGDVVYFNVVKQETRRRPPRLLGSDERYLPHESTTWVRRIDDNGDNYYLQLETNETSWTPPPHHFMCVSCKHNFATRRWNETGSRYCIVCYADGLRKGLFQPIATWTKLSVQPAKCVVCRNAPAEVVCHQCKGDATCQSCCRAVHRNPRLASHDEMVHLVY